MSSPAALIALHKQKAENKSYRTALEETTTDDLLTAAVKITMEKQMDLNNNDNGMIKANNDCIEFLVETEEITRYKY